MIRRLAELSKSVSAVTRWFASAGLLLMTAIIAWQVFARYVLNASPAWAEQAALLLMIWYVMLAAAAGIREGFIRITVIAQALPEGLQRWAGVTAHLVVATFGIAMIVWGIELVDATWRHVIPTLALPRGVAYIPMPLAGLLFVAFSIEQAVALLRNAEVSETWN